MPMLSGGLRKDQNEKHAYDPAGWIRNRWDVRDFSWSSAVQCFFTGCGPVILTKT